MGASNNSKSANSIPENSNKSGPPSMMKAKTSEDEPLLPNAITLANLLSRPNKNPYLSYAPDDGAPVSPEGNKEAIKLKQLLAENGWAFVLLPEGASSAISFAYTQIFASYRLIAFQRFVSSFRKKRY